MNEESGKPTTKGGEWNVVMAPYRDNLGRIRYYAQRSKRNFPSEKILAQDLTEQEAFSLLCSFGEVNYKRGNQSKASNIYIVDHCR